MDPLGQDEVGVAEAQREHRLVEQRGDRYAGLPVVGVVGRGRVGVAVAAGTGEVELDVGRVRLGLADHGVVRTLLAEVDPALVATGQVRDLADGRDVLLGPGRVGARCLSAVVGRPLVAVGGDDAVAVGVDRVEVGPVLRALRQTVLAHLADAEHHVTLAPADRVAVDVEDRRHGVVATHLLLLLEQLLDQARVDQPDAGVRHDVPGELFGGRGETPP